MKPLDAKRYFNSQVWINYFKIVGIFVPFALVVSSMQYWFIADAALIGILWFIFFQVMDQKTVSIDCPSCDGVIKSNTPWVCGFCKRTNKGGAENSFLKHCVCGAEPKAYKCHHCEELIFLSDDRLKANYAYCLNLNTIPLAPVPVDRLAKRKEDRDVAQHELEIAKLKREKKAVKSSTKKVKDKTPAEELQELEEKFLRDRANFLGVEDFAEKHLAKFAKANKKNPERIERERDFIQRWLQERIQI